MIKRLISWMLWIGMSAFLPGAESSILGRWEGSMPASGSPGMLTVIFRIAQDALATTATIEVPEQKLMAPARVFRQPGNKVIFELQGVGQYEGIISADGKQIQGAWKQRSIAYPMTLQRILKTSPDTRAITEWIRKKLLPLKTTDPQASMDDIAPMKKMVGNARIVSVGEATHGTREFFQLKHRILKFLVEQMGFTVFAMEANLPEARFINEYVLHGGEDPQKALDRLHSWPWKTEEVLEMVEWMRAYNADPAHMRKVKFYGFDMQIPNMAAANVILYLQRVDPQYAAKAVELLSRVPVTEAERTRFASSQDAQLVLEQIGELEKHLDALPHAEEGWPNARQDARIVDQAVRMMLAGDRSIFARDKAMADNIQWILDQEGPEAKIMLWAHNGHVRAIQEESKMWMGSHLRNRFGSNMVVMGFVFNQGSFRAIAPNKEPRDFTVGPASPGSLDSALAATRQSLFAVDLRTATAGAIAGWLRTAQRSREIGAGYSEDMASWMLEQPPAEAFDILLFVETTTPTRALRAK